jgi:hypothetical protein
MTAFAEPIASLLEECLSCRHGMHDAVLVRAMRQSVALLLLLAAAACGSSAQIGSDGGGGSSAGGAGGGGRGGGGAAGGCAPNQVWCPGCEPGTGACSVGGCLGVACPPLDGGGGGASGAGGGGGSGGGSGGTGGSALCGARACTSSELCVHPSCGGSGPICTLLPDGGQCPSGWTMRASCPFAAGPGCEAPPCTPPDPYCITPPASCGATPTCACLPSDVCLSSGCGLISGGQVLCVSA